MANLIIWMAVQGMLEDLGQAPRGSIILLHACAHNPVRNQASAEVCMLTLSPAGC